MFIVFVVVILFCIECITKERTQIQQAFNYMKLDLVRSFKNIQNDWFCCADLQLIKSHFKGKHFLIIKMKGEERVEITHGLYPTNVTLTSKIVSLIIHFFVYSIRLNRKI